MKGLNSAELHTILVWVEWDGDGRQVSETLYKGTLYLPLHVHSMHWDEQGGLKGVESDSSDKTDLLAQNLAQERNNAPYLTRRSEQCIVFDASSQAW